ncbi:MAG TPA: radical SAM protein [Candidatus Methanoperedens sp.]|nr:radical SAM protein [Candidatus Methanoperedens sp.]
MNRLRRRLTILGKLGTGLLTARLTGRRRPVFMGLYITNRCNLRCKYCFVNLDDRFDKPERWGFSREEVLRVVDELHAMGMRWVFLLGGEPLMHPAFGDIVRHIAGKDILLHVLTNGTLIEQKIDELEPADGVCVSIDGAEQATDEMRGAGTFRKALRGVEAALGRGLKTRIHAVLNKHSQGDMEGLAQLAREMGVTITISPPNFLGSCEDPALQLSAEEYRDFYRRYRSLKERGFPIGNSFFAIDKALNWPVGYHEFIRTGQSFPGYEPMPCAIGDLHGCIDAEGTMFNCIQRGCLAGPNIGTAGIAAAWEALPSFRPGCVSCASVNTIEASAYLYLRNEVLMDGVRFFFGRRRPAR